MEEKSDRQLGNYINTKTLRALRNTKRFIVFLCAIIASLLSHNSYAQQDSSRITVTAEIIDNDTLPLMVLKPYDVIEKPDPNAIKKLNEINRLYVNVNKVLPYARLAKAKLDEIKDHVSTMESEHDKKVYIKQMEKEMRDRFEAELKNLTITQGRILIKLIDRETGETSYELVKELRGTLSATFWQGMAHLFGSDLKTTYDSTSEDNAVEQIIRKIDSTGFKPIILNKNPK